ncbi:MAG: glycoside hydrolase family 9 protein [Bacteroidales bacterium]|nr:glycoside hydrolase family 9 protein [Clostridium sp.]MCM1204227.1 glycoside hydrolase family 9 protein [Bacteroidales bacterium]
MAKGKRRLGKRIAAWLLAFIMAAGLAAVPAKDAKAADKVTVTGADDTSKPIHVKLSVDETKRVPAGKWGANSPAEDLDQYAVEIVNGSAGTISDWELTITCNSLSTYNAGWNGVSKSGNNIIVGTYKGTGDDGLWTNATISAGESANGAGFQIASREMANATYTLTYQLGESSGSPSVDDTATDPSAIGETSDKVKVTFTESNVAGEYHEYYLQIDNQTGTSIGDWIVAVPIKGVTKVEDWSSWAQIKTAYTSDYLYISPVASAVIPAGASFGSTNTETIKFNYFANSKPDNAVVYYKTGTSSSNAFDSVINNATGGSPVGGGGGTSGSGGVQGDTTTDLGLDVEYNFAKLLQESLYFYDANMCGELEGKCALDWRGNCHLRDKTVTYKGKTVDVSGGFHDAGDHDKFGLPQGYTASILGLGFYEFKDAYEETGQTAHFKTILDYFCDYFVRCTVLDSSGNAEAFCYQVGDGASHNSWVSAEKENLDRPAYFADSSTPATDQVSEAAAALAIHYVNFGNETYLEYAEKLFAMAQRNSKQKQTDAQGGAYYGSSSWADDYCLAAAWLYKATKKESYLNEYKRYESQIDTGADPAWDQVGPYAAAYGGNLSPLAANASQKINSATKVSNGYAWLSEWGSARYNCNVQLEGLIYDKNSGKEQQYTEWATGQMKFLLGNSADKRCYVVGYNANSSKYPHHRSASGYSDWPNNGNNHTVQAHVLVGALVGGIENTAGVYHDDSNDYRCNEVAIDYNAAFTGAAAGLYLANKKNPDIAQELATKKELTAVGVTKYYEMPSGVKVPVESVSLDEEEITLEVKGTKQLTASVSPAEATNRAVTWSSSDATVAAVSSSGMVTAVAPGEAVITATTRDGEKTASCRVTVNKKKITSVTFPAVSGTVTAGTALEQVRLSKTSDEYGTFAWKNPKQTVTADMTGAEVIYTLSETAKKTAELAAGIEGVSEDKTQVTRTVTFTVEKQKPVVTVPPVIAVQAGTKLSGVPVTECTSSVEGTFSWKEEDRVLTIDDDGEEFTLVFEPEDKVNYTAVEKTAALKVTRKQYEKTPEAPELLSKTADCVVLKEYAGEETVQYGIKTGTGDYVWGDSSEFTGLEAYTGYRFALRYAETRIYEASGAGAPLDVTTYMTEKDCYYVDLSKVEDAGYIEAHNGKLTYDADTKTVILPAGDYTVTGENAKVTVSVEGAGTLTLNSAAMKRLNVTADVVIKLVGDNVISEGIHGGRNTVTIQNGKETGKAGSLEVSGSENAAVEAGTIILESGKVTAAGSGDAAALKADEIRLLGGILIANAAEGITPIQAEKIVIEGCQIQSDAEKIYSVEPVDAEGNRITFCKVVYQNADGETIAEVEVKRGGTITLDNLKKLSGYKALGWKKDGSKEVLAVGTEEIVSGDVVYVAEYIEISGELEVKVYAGDAEELKAGYTSDDGVLVEVINKTNVTIDELTFTHDNTEEFTLSVKDAQNLEPLNEEESNAEAATAKLYVRLKKGMGVNTEGYSTILTISCEELTPDIQKEIKRVVKKAATAKPAKPQLKSKTASSVILQTVSGAEYGIKQNGTVEWQESAMFTGLEAYTGYTFVIRIKETADKEASPASDELEVITYMTEEEQFKVDVSRVTIAGYIEAHGGTVSLEENVLTLEEAGTYIITGSNENLIIRAEKDVTVILDNAVIKAIEAVGDCTELNILLKGNSEIVSEKTAAVKGGAGCTVTISNADEEKPGSVIIAGGNGNAGITAGNVTISDGTVTVTGNGAAAGITASGTVTIEGGKLTVTGGENGAAIKAETVIITGGTVSVTGQGDKPAIEAENKDIKVEIQQKNGNSYKEPEKGDDDKDDDKEEEDKKDDDDDDGDEESDDEIEATGLKVVAKVKGAGALPVQKVYKLAPKKSMTLQVAFLPANAEKEKLTYSSSNPKLVKVNKSGKITAGKKAGTATITVKSENGLKKTFKVKVMKKPVTKIKIKAAKKVLKVKKTLKLKAVTTPGKASASNEVVWKSNKTKVATVSAKGVVKACKKGTVKITAYATDGSGKKAVITLKVK